MAEFFEAIKNSFNDTFGGSIDLGSGSILTLNIIVWSIFIGFLIGIGATIYNKAVLGQLVRAIIDKQIFTKDRALTLKELGCSNIFVRFALRSGSSFRRVVRTVEDTEVEDSKLSLGEAKFFIPDENLHRAEKIYGNLGVGILSIILCVIVFFVLTLVALIVIPDLTQLVSNFISDINS